MRCATKFRNLSNSWFNSKGITQYELINSKGATEVANQLGVADLCIDLSSTGETLRQNNLKVIDTILKSSACLFYSKKSLKKKGVNKIIKLLSKD
jgi:ATP phosphoribosyltransferase